MVQNEPTFQVKPRGEVSLGATGNTPEMLVLQKGDRSNPRGLASATVEQKVTFMTLVHSLGASGSWRLSQCLGKGREGCMSRGILGHPVAAPSTVSVSKGITCPSSLSSVPRANRKGQVPGREHALCLERRSQCNYVRYKLVFYSFLFWQAPRARIPFRSVLAYNGEERAVSALFPLSTPTLWFCPISMHSSTCYKIITKTLLWGRPYCGVVCSQLKVCGLGSKRNNFGNC